VDERRTAWVLILLLVAQLGFLALQGARAAATPTQFEALTLRLLGPLARVVSAVPQNVTDVGEGLRTRRTLQDDNLRLRRQVEELQLRLLHLNDISGELSRLGEAVRYSTPAGGEIRAVDIVYADHASWLRTLLLFTGGKPARTDQPVLSVDGLVGRVMMVAGPYAKVQLITDRAASVGAMIVRTRRQGVVRGGGRGGGTLELDYVPLQADVRPGDQVVTAGIDGLYPRGIPLGTIAEVEGGGQLFHRITVAPAVDFGRLDQVYLLGYSGPPAALKEPEVHAKP
jgi:rod shape-determining protein MreC